MTVTKLLRWARDQAHDIEVHDQEEYESNNRTLLAHILGVSSTRLIVDADNEVDESSATLFKGFLEKRKSGEPISYLTGCREFWSLPFFIDHRVLIPRHETETLVERVLARTESYGSGNILELGTGSGAIALALASERELITITATDISNDALDVARYNQKSLGFKNVDFVLSSWFSNLAPILFDLICSNPPYVAENDEHLNQGDVSYEPRSALVADDCGFSDLEKIIDDARSFLRPGAWIILEHGYEQGNRVRMKFAECNYCEIETFRDLSGNERVTEGRMSNHY